VFRHATLTRHVHCTIRRREKLARTTETNGLRHSVHDEESHHHTIKDKLFMIFMLLKIIVYSAILIVDLHR
jgi:hypothetical protein